MSGFREGNYKLVPLPKLLPEGCEGLKEIEAQYGRSVLWMALKEREMTRDQVVEARLIDPMDPLQDELVVIEGEIDYDYEGVKTLFLVGVERKVNGEGDGLATFALYQAAMGLAREVMRHEGLSEIQVALETGDQGGFSRWQKLVRADKEVSYCTHEGGELSTVPGFMAVLANMGGDEGKFVARVLPKDK